MPLKRLALPIFLAFLRGAQGVALPATDVTTTAATSEATDAAAASILGVEAPSSAIMYAAEDVIATTVTANVSAKRVPTGTVHVLPSLSKVMPHTEGYVVTTIESIRSGPLVTASIPPVTSLIKPLTASHAGRDEPEDVEELVRRAATDIFASPIATIAPAAKFKRKTNHPVARKGIINSGPKDTNKFYTNFFLGNSTSPTYTYPYAVTYLNGDGVAASYGISMTHTEASNFVYGDVQYNNAARYYINPVGVEHMILSATELGRSTVLEMDRTSQFHARILLKKNSAAAPTIYFPIVQGMSYLTGRFEGGHPMIQSGVYFKSMTQVKTDPKKGVRKYVFKLEDGTTWNVYGYHTSGSALTLTLINSGLAQSTDAFTGVVQIAKNPGTNNAEMYLDDGAGVWPCGATLTGSVSGHTGTYSIEHDRCGHPNGYMNLFALPHHVASFDKATSSLVTGVKMQTPTKGNATLVRGRIWTMVESALPTAMSFGPWSSGPKESLSTAAKAAIEPIAKSEASQDMIALSNVTSMYYGGKVRPIRETQLWYWIHDGNSADCRQVLLKFAQLVYVMHDLVGDTAMAQSALVNLKAAYKVFADNTQAYPLVYDSAWGGAVSSASYVEGDSGLDFGNTYYNDHHFHYGYHILAAAYIGHLDSTWAENNKDYVNMLVRDIANPSSEDTYFPQSRHFDWYHGHSWAKGLFEASDGKDQESSSEDIMASYAIKMWGTVIGDSNMVARGNLQLAIMRRSMQSYYLYTNNNAIEPSRFIGNKAAGIVFENKIDHTTYFSNNIECIQGIHMIPVLAPSGFIRSKTFIEQEWNTYFANGAIDKIESAWKSIIWANYALVAPEKAWAYFNSSSLNTDHIDGGATRAWYMAYAAGESCGSLR
ncbi:endo-1,3(4)-beta-glucanase, partial [Geosmithia morbida]